MNIGEVFIALGFDVDEAKLKGFTDKINGLQKDMLGLSAIAAGTVLGLDAFMRSSIGSATALENLHDATGENIITMEKWMSAGHLANTALGYDAIRSSIEGVNKAMSDISMGHGNTQALGMLHLSWQNADGSVKKGTEILNEIRKNWARDEEFFKAWGGTQAHLDALEGLGVTRGLQQALMQSDSEFAKGASNYIDVESTIARNKKLGQDIENLTGKISKLKDTLIGEWAEPLGRALDQVAPEFKKISDGFSMINETALKTAGVVAASLAIMFNPLFAAGAAAIAILNVLDMLGEAKRVGWSNLGKEMKEGAINSGLDFNAWIHRMTGTDTPEWKMKQYAIQEQLYSKQGSRDESGQWTPPVNQTVNLSTTVHSANDPQAVAGAVNETNRNFADVLKQLNNGGQ